MMDLSHTRSDVTLSINIKDRGFKFIEDLLKNEEVEYLMIKSFIELKKEVEEIVEKSSGVKILEMPYRNLKIGKDNSFEEDIKWRGEVSKHPNCNYENSLIEIRVYSTNEEMPIANIDNVFGASDIIVHRIMLSKTLINFKKELEELIYKFTNEKVELVVYVD